MHKKLKKISVFLLVLLCFSNLSYGASLKNVRVNNSKILVDGKEVNPLAYTIDSNNYFKLRDVAYILTESKKQFNVKWNHSSKSVEIVPKQAYKIVGNECSRNGSKIRDIYKSRNKVYMNNKVLNLNGYTINSNNYYKLRDLGKELDIAIIWNGKRNMIEIRTDLTYSQGEKLEKELNEASKVSSFESEVIDLVNKERSKRGLRRLEKDNNLVKAARDKSSDMFINKYFSHISPKFGKTSNLLDKRGISYGYMGENIAKGHRSPKQVVDAWMKSPGHRANILNPNYRKIGVGLYEDKSGTKYWTQVFTD